jgi:uncharacterized membrane protein
MQRRRQDWAAEEPWTTDDPWTADARGREAPAGGDGLARALGVVSVALGIAQIAAPRRIVHLVGVRDTERNRDTMRVAGAMAAVAGVLALDAVAARRWDQSAVSRPVVRHGRPVARSVTVRRPAEEVYAFWRRLENLPRFMDHLESVRAIGERHSHWRARAPAGMSVEWDAEIVIDRPNELIAWRSMPGSAVPNSGQVRFVGAPGHRGTEVHVELLYSPPAGKLGVIVARLLGEEPGQQVAADLRRFKQVLETGEIVYSGRAS